MLHPSSPMHAASQVVLFVLCTAVFGIPHPTPSVPRSWATITSHQAPSVLMSEAAPKSLRIPWPGQIPKSNHVMIQRATSSSGSTAASSTIESNSSLGQIVVTSTKMTTLPPAVCGFVPIWNETSSAIGRKDINIIFEWQVKLMNWLDIVGCVDSNIITGVSTLFYDDSQTCETSSGPFFCRGTSFSTILTGCVDVYIGTTYIYSWTSYLSTYYDPLISSTDIVETSWPMEIMASGVFQVLYTTSAITYTTSTFNYYSSTYTQMLGTTTYIVTNSEISNSTVSNDPLQISW